MKHAADMTAHPSSWNRFAFTPIVCLLCLLSVYVMYDRRSLSEQLNQSSTHETKTFTILAFGDSLTEGIMRIDPVSFHPYTIQLQKLLAKTSNNQNIILKNLGVSGELASDMPSRLNKYLNNNINLVIILAGTNDYIWLVADQQKITRFELLEQVKQGSQIPTNTDLSQKIDKIYRNILKLHEICHSQRIITGIVTLPDIKFETDPFYTLYANQRKRINENLRKFAEENIQKTIFIDLASHIPYVNEKEEFRKKYWSDAVHFSEEGYDKMASLIYYVLKERKYV